MAVIIHHSQLNPKTGEIFFEKKNFDTHKTFKLILLNKDPFEWTSTILKDTDNRKETFVKSFIEGAGLSYENLLKVSEWFPSYYTSFLMEASNTISLLGFEEFKKELKEELNKIQKDLGKTVDILKEINKDTKIGELSDILFPFTQIGNMLICYN